MNIVVFSSDDRMMQVADNLARDFHVIAVCDVCSLMTCHRDMDVLILPVKGVDDKGNIQGMHVDASFWEELSVHTKICSGLRTSFLEQLPQAKYYYMEDEGVINDNAILTAEGVLNELIGCCARSIYDVVIDVVGYGHCGRVIYEMLHNLQLQVRVIRRDCVEEGDFIKIDSWEQCGDIIINTSIQNVMNEERMRKWRKRPVIIDIATPDVIDLSCADCMQIRVIKACNLPGRFASVSAGNIIAEYIRGKITS